VDRFDDISTALDRMPEKKLVAQAWSRIKAHSVPDSAKLREPEACRSIPEPVRDILSS